MTALKISVFGSLLVSRGKVILKGFESNKVRALLAYLVMEINRSHRREVLAELFWPESPPQAGLANLRYALADLRKVIGDDKARVPFLLISRESLQFNTLSDFELDAAAFSDLLKGGDIERLKLAISLYQNNFLSDFPSINSDPFEEWVALMREQFKRYALEALRSITDHHEQRGEYREALPFARRQVELEPWLEEGHQQLMRLLAFDGQRSAALAEYDVCQRLLERELGVEPSRDTARLYELIRDGRLSAPRLITLHVQPESPRRVFVARQGELEKLDAILERACAGHGQVIFITGSPGSGKTALIGEFLRRAIRGRNSLLAATGNCNAYTGVGDPYLPFLQIIHLLTSDVEDKWLDASTADQVARQLHRALPAIANTLADSAPDLLDRFIPAHALLERARRLFPAGGGWLERLEQLIESRQLARGQSDPQQVDLFEQYGHLLASVSQQYPLILAIDDLQWADGGSISLLFHLGKRVADRRILVIGAYRPEEIALGRGEERHPLEQVVNEFQRDFGQIRIDLDRSEGSVFVDALLDSEPNFLSARFRETLHHHTQGNALFTVELLRGLQERGDLIRNAAGQWAEGSSLNWEKLPPRVEAVIAERIGRLPEDLQALLSAASVEGEEFTAEIAARACGTETRHVIQQLSGALSKRHGLVEGQGFRSVGGQRMAGYRFAHFLFQKYLYQQLDETERLHLHQLVGEALEELWGDEREGAAMQLAHHFEQAGIPRKAVNFYWLAGEHAVRLLSNEEAIGHFRHGLELLKSLPDSPHRLEQELKLQISLGVPLLALRGFSDAELEQAYGRARQICQTIGGAPQLFHALRGLKSYYDLRGETYTALELGRQLMSIAEGQGDEDLLIMANNGLGVTLLYAGDLTAYQHHLNRVIDLYHFDRHHLLGFTFGYDPKVATLAHAVGLWMLGYADQALQRSREAVRLADEIKQPFSQGFAYFFSAQLHLLRREAQAALEYADKVIALSKQHRAPLWLANGLLVKGWAIAQLGQAEEGRKVMTQGNDMVRAIGSTFLLFASAAWYGEACGLAGEPEEGLAALDDIIPRSMDAGTLFILPQHYQCKGRLLLMLGRMEEAEAAFEKAIELARQQKAKGWELRATLGLARSWAAKEKYKPAYKGLAEVYNWFTEGFDTPDLIEARALLEELASSDRDRG